MEMQNIVLYLFILQMALFFVPTSNQDKNLSLVA